MLPRALRRAAPQPSRPKGASPTPGSNQPGGLSASVADAHRLLRELVRGSDRWEDPNDPSTVQAMQIVLKLPKRESQRELQRESQLDSQPARSDVLAAAGSAVAQVCLSPEFYADPAARQRLARWYGHRIRKVARRARNKPWEDALALPGITASVGGASARAFLPGAVDEVAHALRRLQIAGTDLPQDHPGEPPATLPLVLVDASLAMTAGKAAAQVGHATMLYAAELTAAEATAWYEAGCPVAVREVPHERFAQAAAADRAVLVIDAGFTEVAPGSATALALPPTEPPTESQPA